MSQVSIALPQPLLDWIDAQVRTGRYVDAGDYVRDLIRHDQEANEDLLSALEEGAASGASSRTLDDAWQAAKSKAGHG